MSDVYQCVCGETFQGVAAAYRAIQHAKKSGNHIVKKVR